MYTHPPFIHSKKKIIPPKSLKVPARVWNTSKLNQAAARAFHALVRIQIPSLLMADELVFGVRVIHLLRLKLTADKSWNDICRVMR